jgi:NAD(P)-dependent dehydrogenase (short-subunit alcohol dehydrogenase family)
MKPNQKVAIVTGSSSGFGKITAISLAKEGFYVVATIRDLQKEAALRSYANENGVSDNILITQLDVTDSLSIENFSTILSRLQHVHVLVNNAGFASAGFLEEVSLDDLKDQFDTNFFGVAAITKLIIPYMRKQKNGHIINVSSISGLVGFPGLSPYVSSKYALEGLSESLRLELSPFKIKVVLVEPGSFKTNIWSIRDDLDFANSSPYVEMGRKIEKAINKGYRSFGDPQEVADLIVEITRKKNPRLRYTIGKGVKTMIRLKRFLSWRLWEKLVLSNINK